MIVVNFFGGPGSGKSTLAAGIFYKTKMAGLNVELATEYAKDATYEMRHNTLKCQPYVFGKQLYRIKRLENHVDLVITDSPILLSIIYNQDYPESFNQSCVDIFNSMNNLNFFVSREKSYVRTGRSQTEEEARQIDEDVIDMLRTNSVKYFNVDGNQGGLERCYTKIVEVLKS